MLLVTCCIRKKNIRKPEDNSCFNYRHRQHFCGSDRVCCGRRLTQEAKETSQNCSKSSTTQLPELRWRGNKAKKPFVAWKVSRDLLMVHRHMPHQNQTPGLTQTLQIIPAVKPCWKRSKHTASATQPGDPHCSTYTGWRLAGALWSGEGNSCGFFLKTTFSCLTLSLLSTAHQGSRAESGRDSSSLDFHTFFKYS